MLELLSALFTQLLYPALSFTALAQPYAQEVYSQTEYDVYHRTRSDLDFEEYLAVSYLLVELAVDVNVFELYGEYARQPAEQSEQYALHFAVPHSRLIGVLFSDGHIGLDISEPYFFEKLFKILPAGRNKRLYCFILVLELSYLALFLGSFGLLFLGLAFLFRLFGLDRFGLCGNSFFFGPGIVGRLGLFFDLGILLYLLGFLYKLFQSVFGQVGLFAVLSAGIFSRSLRLSLFLLWLFRLVRLSRLEGKEKPFDLYIYSLLARFYCRTHGKMEQYDDKSYYSKQYIQNYYSHRLLSFRCKM